MTGLSIGPEEAGRMPFPQYLALIDYWHENPPIHILVKAMFTKR